MVSLPDLSPSERQSCVNLGSLASIPPSVHHIVSQHCLGRLPEAPTLSSSAHFLSFVSPASSSKGNGSSRVAEFLEDRFLLSVFRIRFAVLFSQVGGG